MRYRQFIVTIHEDDLHEAGAAHLNRQTIAAHIRGELCVSGRWHSEDKWERYLLKNITVTPSPHYGKKDIRE